MKRDKFNEYKIIYKIKKKEGGLMQSSLLERLGGD
jgi:hypothetical protein